MIDYKKLRKTQYLGTFKYDYIFILSFSYFLHQSIQYKNTNFCSCFDYILHSIGRQENTLSLFWSLQHVGFLPQQFMRRIHVIDLDTVIFCLLMLSRSYLCVQWRQVLRWFLASNLSNEVYIIYTFFSQCLIIKTQYTYISQL